MKDARNIPPTCPWERFSERNHKIYFSMKYQMGPSCQSHAFLLRSKERWTWACDRNPVTTDHIRAQTFPATLPTSVSIVTRLRTGRVGLNSRRGHWWNFFSSPPRSNRLWGSPSLLSNGNGDSFQDGKRPEREADHSPPASAEVKNAWSLIK